MNVELVNTGSELMLGLVLNTHQQWLCQQLSQLGFDVTRQTAVPDTGPSISTAAHEALQRVSLVIVTGGLGPTSDDLTRDHIAALVGRTLRENPAIVQHIEKFFTTRHRAMPPQTRVQALVPEGAIVLHNAHGTAPGLVLELPQENQPSKFLVLLPGPPRELRPMFLNQVVPLLQQKYPNPSGLVCRVFRTTGLGESLVEQRIADPLQPLRRQGLEVGYCARVGEVDIRLAARGPNAPDLIQAGQAILQKHLAEHVFGTDTDELEAVVVKLLEARRETLVLAESCTGGFIANRITNVPGASAVFLAGLVTYSNAAKTQFLGIKPDLLATHGAVSEPVAREMAEGARARTGATYALAVTGIAGPGGGTALKPVGTVFIGFAKPGSTRVLARLNPFDRETFKYTTSQQALDILRRCLV